MGLTRSFADRPGRSAKKAGRPFGRPAFQKPIYRTIESLSTPPTSRSKALTDGNAAPR